MRVSNGADAAIAKAHLFQILASHTNELVEGATTLILPSPGPAVPRTAVLIALLGARGFLGAECMDTA